MALLLLVGIKGTGYRYYKDSGLPIEYLVVAGGGAGGCNHGAGGGGGFRSTVTATGGGGSLESAIKIFNTTTVTVGAGGAGATFTNRANVTSGFNSVFSTITSTGGGYGANNNRNPATGGLVAVVQQLMV
jgi:hypothetical protein